MYYVLVYLNIDDYMLSHKEQKIIDSIVDKIWGTFTRAYFD